MIPGGAYRHPEWKRLYDYLEPILAVGMLVSYPEIEQWMGLDARTPRGRAQFLRCKREVLVRLNLYFQNVPRIGYRIVEANEHVTSSRGQLDRGQRRIREGVRILVHTRVEKLTQQQAQVHADALVRMSRIHNYVTVERRPMRQSENPPRLPSPGIDPVH